MQSREQRVKQLFDAALERPSEERGAFLDTACATDPELRREVETLLYSLQEASGFLDDAGATGPGKPPGTIIDRYKLQRRADAPGLTAPSNDPRPRGTGQG